mgnify:CR=1 FL=1
MTLTTFKSLGVSEETVTILTKKGYETPTPIQSALIPVFFDSEQDIIGKADTGTGKTGAFGIPLIDTVNISRSNVQALVLTPTRELASQVAKELSIYKGRKKIDVIELCGGQGMREQIDKLKKLKRASIVVGTPGRILDHLSKKRLNLSEISYLIIDEVDEMLNFGFKEDMDNIVDKTNQDRRTIILSATLPKFVFKVAKTYLTNPIELNQAKETSEKPNIDQIYYKANKANKIKLVTRVIDSLEGFYGFLFCNTKREVDQLAEKLMQLGYAAESMHGDLSQAQRNRALERFKSKQCDILVVTDVAARGIDIKNISHVINMSVPQNIEAYTHRIGRTGRAGKSGTAITFVKENDFYKFKRIMKMQKNQIVKKEVPNASDILKIKRAKILNDIEHIETKIEHQEFANKILSDSDPHVAVAALLKLRFSDLFKKNKDY